MWTCDSGHAWVAIGHNRTLRSSVAVLLRCDKCDVDPGMHILGERGTVPIFGRLGTERGPVVIENGRYAEDIDFHVRVDVKVFDGVDGPRVRVRNAKRVDSNRFEAAVGEFKRAAEGARFDALMDSGEYRHLVLRLAPQILAVDVITYPRRAVVGYQGAHFGVFNPDGPNALDLFRGYDGDRNTTGAIGKCVMTGSSNVRCYSPQVATRVIWSEVRAQYVDVGTGASGLARAVRDKFFRRLPSGELKLLLCEQQVRDRFTRFEHCPGLLGDKVAFPYANERDLRDWSPLFAFMCAAVARIAEEYDSLKGETEVTK